MEKVILWRGILITSNLISKSNVYATLTGENKIETPKSDACFIRCVEP